jgi:hypothetical protein
MSRRQMAPAICCWPLALRTRRKIAESMSEGRVERRSGRRIGTREVYRPEKKEGRGQQRRRRRAQGGAGRRLLTKAGPAVEHVKLAILQRRARGDGWLWRGKGNTLTTLPSRGSTRLYSPSRFLYLGLPRPAHSSPLDQDGGQLLSLLARQLPPPPAFGSRLSPDRRP